MKIRQFARTARIVAGISIGGLLMALLTGCAPAPQGDPVQGKIAYLECRGCHKLTENGLGPKHCGVFGRRAGQILGFPYSAAMQQSGIVWNAETLDKFLTSPLTYLNGTNMGYAGLSNAKTRADVIAFLREAGATPAACVQNDQLPQSSEGNGARRS